jgi:hypothetical protein
LSSRRFATGSALIVPVFLILAVVISLNVICFHDVLFVLWIAVGTAKRAVLAVFGLFWGQKGAVGRFSGV